MKVCRTSLAAALIAVSLAATAPLVAQTAKRPMTFADLMAIKRVGDPQISPSGKWVLYTVTDVSLEKNTKTNHLWVAALTGGAPARQLTTGTGESNGRFAPDGHTVAFSADDQVQLAAWDDAAGTLGPAHAITHVQGGADGAIWSPDAKRLLFTAQVYPECSGKPAFAEEDACDKAMDDAAAANPVKAMLFTGLLYRHWDHYTGQKRTHIFVVDADGSQTRDLTPASAVGTAETPTFSLGGPLGYAWAPDSHEIAYVTNLDKVPAASTNNDIFTLRLDEPDAKAVKVTTSPGSDDAPSYSPDGRWLAFRSQQRAGYESDRFRLMALDRHTNAAHEVPNKLDLWVDEFTWSPDSKQLYFASAETGAEPIFATALEGPGHGEVRGVAHGAEFGSLTLTPDGKTLIAGEMKVTMPAEIVALDAAAQDATPRAVTHTNDALLAQLALAPLEPFSFPGAGNTSVQGFVVKPPSFDAAKKYPVKFLIHGGPQGAWGDAWSYRWNPELMAASGYVVVMVNPRGSTGYGQSFIDGVNGDWGGKPYVDLMRGLDYAEQHFSFIDKQRECALGASYGGFMANWILTHTDRFQCIVSHDGMYNPRAAYGTTEELWFNEWEFRRAGDAQPAQPWRYEPVGMDEDPFRKFSPMLFIADAKTPTLVIHGQKDYRLDVSEGLQLFTALQRLNVPSEMLYFPDEGHWVLKPQNSQLWNKTVADWCDRWTHTNAYAAKAR